MSDEDQRGLDVRVVDEADMERFAIWVGEEVAGFTLYERDAGVYSLMHTEIRPEFEHQGLASRLIQSMLDQLAAREVEVLPYCPFVRRYIAKHPEYAALVPETERAHFGFR
jgi:predicted GNAT family acetyltransferase